MDILTKDTGITMGELVKRYKNDHPNVKKACFCGRLDPMARGQVLLLLNENCKKMPDYLNKDKIYEFEIMLGVSTCSTDFLGEVGYTNKLNDYDYDYIKQQILDYIYKYNGVEFEQEYHCYSSKRHEGVPLWKMTKELGVYKQLFHTVKLHNIIFLEEKEYDYIKWRNDNINIIKNIKGDFDQKMKIWRWNNFIKHDKKIKSLKFRINVTSGFYIRQFVRDISNYISFPLLTYDINRINILI